MKQKLLLSLLITAFGLSLHAQKKQQRNTAYAITGVQKGSHNWTEVRLIDLNSGEEVQTIYETSKEVPAFNARTGKPVAKLDDQAKSSSAKKPLTFNSDMEDGDIIVIRRDKNDAVTILHHGKKNDDVNTVTNRNVILCRTMKHDKSFSAKSAACAFDKKHDRLYYTPMGLNQLRYIDLKSKETKLFQFEDEAFGTVKGLHDVGNQITRMAIASDGNGYALTNNAEHLIKFTTNKKAEITDLGAIKDDPANGEISVHSHRGYGGDMVADDNKNLYLITANQHVFKIDIEKMMASYIGALKGLPRGYTTNGTVVEKETSIILSSANTTSGYYKFDLKTLEAEKISSAETVFSASDLANGNLIKEKKMREEEPVAVQEDAKRKKYDEVNPELSVTYKLSAYPNPVAKGDALYIRFNDFPFGRYHVQLMDLSGKLLSTERVNIGGKMQLHLLSLPKYLSQGTYLVKIVGDANKEKTLATEQIVVQ